MKYRTQIVREDADLPMINRVPVPVEPQLIYGDHFHCPACNSAYELTTAVDPQDPWHICALCGQVHDLRRLAKRPNPYTEHGPGMTPAA